jgi:transposase-like protein
MSANLQNPIFQDEAKAREWLEARVWPRGPVCPHCKATAEQITKLEGKKHRPGLYQCNHCREQFTVTVGTVFERSKIPLSKWMATLFLMTASKKGVSAHQIHRSLGVTYKTAWFMCHRLREAMRSTDISPLGGEGKIVESDETYYGPKDPLPTLKGSRYRRRPGPGGKAKVLTLVERGGISRSFKMDDFKGETIKRILVENTKQGTRLMTDEGTSPFPVWHPHFASHETVKHSAEEYVRGDVTTNTVEGFFSVFKRGMRGAYQHCDEKHLHRYLSEFDFRYSNRAALGVNDLMRAEKAAAGIKGKRLTYRRPHSQGDAEPN